jgi:hypothetical protein
MSQCELSHAQAAPLAHIRRQSVAHRLLPRDHLQMQGYVLFESEAINDDDDNDDIFRK